MTYSIVYQTLDGVQRWQKIGRHGVWTPDLARKQARSVLMARDLGKDPSADLGALQRSLNYVMNTKRALTVRS